MTCHRFPSQHEGATHKKESGNKLPHSKRLAIANFQAMEHHVGLGGEAEGAARADRPVFVQGQRGRRAAIEDQWPAMSSLSRRCHLPVAPRFFKSTDFSTSTH